MEGSARDRRLRLLQRGFAPTRLSDDTLRRVYDRVFQVRLMVQEVSEALAMDVVASETSLLVLTGGQHD
jgi:hypothetical protein